MTKNYRANYTCSKCSRSGVKLWRDYNTCADAVELKCVRCADEKRTEPFVFEDGDQLGGLVPAVPTEDGETFWGYTSVDAEGCLWWARLPTYMEPDLEVTCLRNCLIRSMQMGSSALKMWREAQDEASDLRWKLSRVVYTVIKPFTCMIYGSVREPLEGGGFIRYGKEMPRELKPGDRFAVSRGRAVLLLGETYKECPSIMDREQDGIAFAEDCYRKGFIS